MPEGIEFDEGPNVLYSRVERSGKTPKMVQWLTDKGWVRDEKTANIVLLVGVVSILIISLFVWGSVFGRGTDTGQLDETDPGFIPMEQET